MTAARQHLHIVHAPIQECRRRASTTGAAWAWLRANLFSSARSTAC